MVNEGTSRAVLRPIEAGNNAACAACEARVRFSARSRVEQVICNVYVDGRWNRVEHYHAACYAAAGEPHGSAVQTCTPRRASTRVACTSGAPSAGDRISSGAAGGS
ncbi:hypothetical protein BH18ACT4_BH18ACT4_15470 [soil metagenome]